MSKRNESIIVPSEDPKKEKKDDKKTKDTKKKRKKKQTCYQKLRNCIGRCICNRTKKCFRNYIKKLVRDKVFRVPSINPMEYRVAGMNIEDMVDKLKFNKSDNKKLSLTPKQDINKDIKKDINDELGSTSVRKRSLSVVTEISSNKALKKEFLKTINLDELKERVQLPGSKTEIVKQYLQGHANKFSQALQDRLETARHGHRKMDIDNLNREQLVYMLHEYVRNPKKSRFWSQRKFSRRRYHYPSNIQRLSYLDKSRQKNIKRVIRDYGSGKFSRAGLPKNAKLTKSQFEKLLNKYEHSQNRFSFLSLTKIKWFPLK